MPDSRTSWQRRFRRLLFFVGTATSFYLLSSYILDRLREARAKALREKRDKDLMRSHFSSLQNTINFTLYALLPTLQPQISAAYPVEATSQALQSRSTTGESSEASFQPTPESSVVLSGETPRSPRSDHGPPVAAQETAQNLAVTQGAEEGAAGSNVGQSWASEFSRRENEGVHLDAPSIDGSSLLPGGSVDEEASSTRSHSFSLPPTDISSTSASPISDTSPSQRSAISPPTQTADLRDPNELANKSKKELWKDLKIQTLSRSLTTAYLLPLLYLLTSSQLATLARIRYLEDVKRLNNPDPLPAVPTPGTSSAPRAVESERKSGWLGYFSVNSKGLSDFIEANAPNVVRQPLSYLPEAVSRWVPTIPFINPAHALSQDSALSAASEEVDVEAENAEDERVYLSYSWWILHEGWRHVANRVELAVEDVFGRLPLKKDLSVDQWDHLMREVRARVETVTSDGASTLYSFAPQLLPPDPLPTTTSPEPCPLPSSRPPSRKHLSSLLDQTSVHLSSPDAPYLIDKGVTVMVKKLLQKLDEELYRSNGLSPGALDTKRLVDCLPVIDRWGKGVWESIPDNGVEALLALPEFEGFVALIFGDWAPS